MYQKHFVEYYFIFILQEFMGQIHTTIGVQAYMSARITTVSSYAHGFDIPVHNFET
jgi:hypothetical protein